MCGDLWTTRPSLRPLFFIRLFYYRTHANLWCSSNILEAYRHVQMPKRRSWNIRRPSLCFMRTSDNSVWVHPIDQIHGNSHVRRHWIGNAMNILICNLGNPRYSILPRAEKKQNALLMPSPSPPPHSHHLTIEVHRLSWFEHENFAKQKSKTLVAGQPAICIPQSIETLS